MKNRYFPLVIGALICGAAFSQTASPSNSDQEQPMAPVPQILAASAMNEQDATLLASQHAAIARAAQIYGYEPENGSWTTSQALCPDAPDYLIAQMSDGDAPAKSFFTVLIPRKGGPPRLIPVLHRGSPNSWMFGEDKLQREFLDQTILVKAGAAEPNGTRWTKLAGCYAALEGVELTGDTVANSVVVNEAAMGKLRDIAFVGIRPDGRRVRWFIQYDPRGKIQNMEVAAAGDFRLVPQGPAPREKPIAASSQPQNWRQISPSSQPQNWKQISPK